VLPVLPHSAFSLSLLCFLNCSRLLPALFRRLSSSFFTSISSSFNSFLLFLHHKGWLLYFDRSIFVFNLSLMWFSFEALSSLFLFHFSFHFSGLVSLLTICLRFVILVMVVCPLLGLLVFSVLVHHYFSVLGHHCFSVLGHHYSSRGMFFIGFEVEN